MTSVDNKHLKCSLVYFLLASTSILNGKVEVDKYKQTISIKRYELIESLRQSGLSFCCYSFRYIASLKFPLKYKICYTKLSLEDYYSEAWLTGTFIGGLV